MLFTACGCAIKRETLRKRKGKERGKKGIKGGRGKKEWSIHSSFKYHCILALPSAQKWLCPSLKEFIIYNWRGKMAGNHTSSSGDKELCSSLDVTAFASLSSISCGTWWNCLFSPPKFRSVTVPHSQCHSCSENIHQSISWNQTAKHHCNAGQVHGHFSFFFFFPEQEAMLIPLRTQTPAISREADVVAEQMVLSCCWWVGNTTSPPTDLTSTGDTLGNSTHTHTLPSPPGSSQGPWHKRVFK